MQIGMGMVLGSVDILHTQGNAQGTGNITDLCIDGEGFFIVNSGTGSLYYTRAGAFDFDRQGNFVNPDGLIVQGWYLDEQGNRVGGRDNNTVNPSAPPSDLALIHQLAPPKPTESVVLTGNLHDGTAAEQEFTRSFTVYDKKGNDYDVEIVFAPKIDDDDKAVPNEWKWEIAEPIYNEGEGEDGVEISGEIHFHEDGSLKGVSVDAWLEEDLDVTEIPLRFIAEGGGTTTQVFDFSGITQYADPRGESQISVQQDGYTYGNLEELVVDDKGVISASFSNGTSRPLLQVALATFGNPAGLIGRGNSLYALSNNCGEPEIESPGMGRAGAVSPSSLEMSNVDLSEEFTDMIVTQRGFQANSRVITASDEMLQELVNMKR